MATLQYTLPVCSHYISALANDDWTGLSDEDCDVLQEWIDYYIESLQSRIDFVVDPLDCYDPRFTVDDVTGLFAECVDVAIYTY